MQPWKRLSLIPFLAAFFLLFGALLASGCAGKRSSSSGNTARTLKGLASSSDSQDRKQTPAEIAAAKHQEAIARQTAEIERRRKRYAADLKARQDYYQCLQYLAELRRSQEQLYSPANMISEALKSLGPALGNIAETIKESKEQ